MSIESRFLKDVEFFGTFPLSTSKIIFGIFQHFVDKKIFFENFISKIEIRSNFFKFWILVLWSKGLQNVIDYVNIEHK